MEFYRARYSLACWSSIAVIIHSVDCYYKPFIRVQVPGLIRRMDLYHMALRWSALANIVSFY
ncbi:MAG: hypothetical protein OXN17_19420 [Candidatus Poribacteria bacterium]|nr:hypothetical protein [Candidatus Poribacteria bacterium]